MRELFQRTTVLNLFGGPVDDFKGLMLAYKKEVSSIRPVHVYTVGELVIYTFLPLPPEIVARFELTLWGMIE